MAGAEWRPGWWWAVADIFLKKKRKELKLREYNDISPAQNLLAWQISANINDKSEVIPSRILFLAVLGCCCCMRAFSSCGRRGLLSSCSARVSHCSGLSCWGAGALSTQAFVVAARGLSSRGTRASLPWDVWNLLGPGFEPVSPALECRLLTTGPRGKYPLVVSSW